MAKKKSTKKATKKSASKSAKKSAKKSVKKSSKKAKTAKKATKQSSAKSSRAKSGKKTAKKKSTSKSSKPKSAGKKKSPAKTSGGKKSARSGKLKSPLKKKQLNEFRDLLLEKRRSLIGDMVGMTGGGGRSMQESSGDLSNMPTHPADIGSDNFEHEFTLGLLESERKMLDEINEALQRIEDGTFGICMGTGEPIGLPRLKARPWCKYSIEYQRLIEKGLAQPRDEDNRFGVDDADDDIDEQEDEDLDEIDDFDDDDADFDDYDED